MRRPGLHDAPDERDVFLLDLAIVELPRQFLVRGVVLGHDHHAGRAAIEAVHDARAHLAANAAQVGKMMQQRVHERPRAVAGGGMDHHAGGLVHHGQILVLIQDVDGQRLAADGRGRGVGELHVHEVAVAQLQVGLGDAPGDGHAAVGDQLLKLRARMAAEKRSQKAIEALAPLLGGHHEVGGAVRVVAGHWHFRPRRVGGDGLPAARSAARATATAT